MIEYNCSICNNEQWIIKNDRNRNITVYPCSCQNVRKMLFTSAESGFGDLLDIFSFGNYEEKFPWQKEIKDKAVEYTKERNKWFCLLGQSGAGKTHICTAICKEFISRGFGVVYMPWLEVSGGLKRRATEKEYEEMIEKYEKAQVLFIDDFWKSENSTAPTPADIKLANEIINYRYNRSKVGGRVCKTIISSERTLMQLIAYDEAVAGRIVEMSSGYLKEIKGFEKNYRLKDVL